MKDRFIVALAQGWGVGRIPFGPGTWGSLVGLLWFVLLLQTPNLWWFLAGTAAGLGCSVWICGAAENILRERDPSSVVLDEVAAVPLCFIALVASAWVQQGRLPEAAWFFEHPGWTRTAVVFVLFRVFDIAKPWPVRQSQNLAGGWGVTADDVLAAVYVNLLQLPFLP